MHDNKLAYQLVDKIIFLNLFLVKASISLEYDSGVIFTGKSDRTVFANWYLWLCSEQSYLKSSTNHYIQTVTMVVLNTVPY